MEQREKLLYLADRLPTQEWLTQLSVREVEQRLRKFGLSQKMAKQAISDAKHGRRLS